jgi:hypothetical protein
MQDRGTATGGKVQKAAKLIYLNETFDFLRSTDFKLLRQIKENVTNICDFFSLKIFVTGGHGVYSPRGSENLTKLPDKTARVVFKSLLFYPLLSKLEQRGALLTYMLTA